ncbi:MAG TPA: hypothetical protein VNL77_25550 [Roseiflexaceae bacterium]|nr:hypothetical protein [Roseiflexaceae bacterium]
MALSFTLSPLDVQARGAAGMRRHVLVTGAAGTIGSYFASTAASATRCA